MLPGQRGGGSSFTRAAGILTLIITVAGCSRYPIVSVAEAERAHQRALEAEAPLYSSEQYRNYQTVLESAYDLLAEQQRRWVFRRYGAAETLLKQARSMADAAAAEAAAERDKRRVEVETEVRAFEEALELIREGRLAQARRSLSKAEISLATAKAQWEAGDYNAASRTLTAEAEAIRLLSDLREAYVKRNTDPNLISQWNKAVKATISNSAKTGDHALIVNKYRQTLSLYRAGRHVADYVADLGANPFTEKRLRGDRATPEGRYRIVKKLGAGQSAYYKALVINYPNDKDLESYRG